MTIFALNSFSCFLNLSINGSGRGLERRGRGRRARGDLLHIPWFEGFERLAFFNPKVLCFQTMSIVTRLQHTSAVQVSAPKHVVPESCFWSLTACAAGQVKMWHRARKRNRTPKKSHCHEGRNSISLSKDPKSQSMTSFHALQGNHVLSRELCLYGFRKNVTLLGLLIGQRSSKNLAHPATCSQLASWLLEGSCMSLFSPRLVCHKLSTGAF